MFERFKWSNVGARVTHRYGHRAQRTEENIKNPKNKVK